MLTLVEHFVYIRNQPMAKPRPSKAMPHMVGSEDGSVRVPRADGSLSIRKTRFPLHDFLNSYRLFTHSFTCIFSAFIL